MAWIVLEAGYDICTTCRSNTRAVVMILSYLPLYIDDSLLVVLVVVLVVLLLR